MRVGPLAKGLLITGDWKVDLVMLCSGESKENVSSRKTQCTCVEKPTRVLLDAAASLLRKEIAV